MSVRKVVTAAVFVSTFGALAATAGEQELAIIHDRCGVQLNQPPMVCDCIASSASVRLNQNQQAFMVAQITADAAGIARTQTLLSADEALGVAEFMTTVIEQCGG